MVNTNSHSTLCEIHTKSGGKLNIFYNFVGNFCFYWIESNEDLKVNEVRWCCIKERRLFGLRLEMMQLHGGRLNPLTHHDTPLLYMHVREDYKTHNKKRHGISYSIGFNKTAGKHYFHYQ